MENEVSNFIKSLQNFGKALREVFARFWDVIRATAKKLYALIKELQEFQERGPQQSMIFVWQEQQQLHQHQVITKMKVQQRTMLSYQQPWKAWKAQRR